VLLEATGIFQIDLETLLQVWGAEVDVRKQVSTMRAMDHGDMLRHTPGMPDEDDDHKLRRPRFGNKLLTALLDKLSYLYSRDPVRAAPKAGVWKDVLWDWGIGLSAILQEADRETRLADTTLAVIKSGYSERLGPIEYYEDGEIVGRETQTPDGIDVRLYTRDRWAALVHPLDHRQLAAVLIDWRPYVVELENGKCTVIREFLYLDAAQWAIIRDGVVVDSDFHEAGVVPAVTLPNTLSNDIYGRRGVTGPDSVVDLQTMAKYSEQCVHVGILQRGDLCMTTGTEGAQGPDCKWTSPDVGGVWYANNNGNIPHMLQELQSMVDIWCLGNGMPEGSFVVTGDTQSRTVDVVVAENIDLSQDRVRRERVARKWERDMKAETGQSLNPDVKVLYMQMPEPLTHEQRMAQADWLMERGLVARADGLREAKPHLTDTEIADMLKRADEDLPGRVREQVAIAGHANEVGITNIDGAEPSQPEMTDDVD
jgi:hypothetical protein